MTGSSTTSGRIGVLRLYHPEECDEPVIDIVRHVGRACAD